MVDDVRRTIRKELAKLNSERARIDRQISALETALGVLDGGRPEKAARTGRRKMSAATRKAIAKRMKAYWAKRRVKAKSK